VKHFIFTCLLFSCCATSFSQTGRVSGVVIDNETKTPLELATVSIYREDSSLITYQLSDKNGKFAIDKLPLKKQLIVNVSYTGYITYNTTLQLEGGKPDTLAVYLSLNTKDNNAVVVTATIPIRMNGDTLEINPAAFKLKPDAVVEELLNQVSGIVIWSDGTITVNGKQVQSLLVDGKPFLGTTDSRVVTQNLPKSAIDKIQLYQEYDRSNVGITNQPPVDSLLTMNIKLKENSKNGFFGKAGAGYGTTDRFESDLSFQMYNKRSSGGIGGGFNNINKSIGNIQEMFQNNTYRNYNPNLYNVGRFGSSGINKNYSLGGVYTHSFIETANSRQNNRIVVNYNKAGTDAYITDLNLQNRTVVDNQQLIRSEGWQNNRQDKHDVGINYVKTNSYNDNLNMNGALSTSNDRGNSFRNTEVRDSANRLQSTNTANTVQSRRSNNETLNVRFGKSNYEEPLKNFNIQFNARRGDNASERETRSIFKSLTDSSENRSDNRRYSSNSESIDVGGTLTYSGFKRLLLGRFNLFGIDLNLSQQLNYNRVKDNSLVNDYDSASKTYILNSELSNYNKRELFAYEPSLGLSKSWNKYNETMSRYVGGQARFSDEMKTDKNISSFAKRNLVRSFRFFRYEGNLYYNYQKRQRYEYNFSTGYAKSFDYPSIDQLYAIVDDINVYNIRFGNPSLKNRTNHRVNFYASFNTRNPKSDYSINSNINGTYNQVINPVADSIINDLSGKRFYYYTNADKSSNLNFGYSFNISRKFGKNNLQLRYNAQFNSSKVPNYVDGVNNISKSGNLSNQFDLQYTLRSVLVVTASQTLQRYQSSQTSSKLRSFKNSSNTSRLGVVLNYPSQFSFSSTVDRVANSNLNEPTFLWNAFATYRFMKNQGELKLSAMDLLKQYQNITNSSDPYGTSTRITNGLQQYFLLTFSYYPRKFGKTEMKKQTNSVEY
jgi:hypothetical protein